MTLTDWLRVRGGARIGRGASYIASLLHDIPTAANIAYHARIVREKAVLRQLIHSVTDIAGRGYEGPWSFGSARLRREEDIRDLRAEGPSLVHRHARDRQGQLRDDRPPVRAEGKDHGRSLGVHRSRSVDGRVPGGRSHHRRGTSSHGEDGLLPEHRPAPGDPTAVARGRLQPGDGGPPARDSDALLGSARRRAQAPVRLPRRFRLSPAWPTRPAGCPKPRSTSTTPRRRP